MYKIINWAKQNEDKIGEYIKRRDYTKLLNEYHAASGYSVNKAAAMFKCSRRAFVRYLSGERQVPMYIVKSMLKEMQLNVKTWTDSLVLHKNATDFSMEKDAEGRFVWYGKSENGILFNSLYAYRTIKYEQTRFQAACELNITEDMLYEYESGKRKITYTDIQKIMDVYNLKLEELFPSLVSYDGRKTFLPLRPITELKISGNNYDVGEGELYINDENDVVSINTWPSFPIQRYDENGRPLLKYMPGELTVDEYINTDELVFMKDEIGEYYEKDLNGMKLPPNYLPFLGLARKKSSKAKYYGYHYIMTNVTINDDYTVTVKCNKQKNTFDLSQYVFSDSPWYGMLQDKEYFHRAKVTFVGERAAQNQCLIWPDGQYIRFIELYLPKYPYNYYAYPYGYHSNSKYDNWTIYRSE